MKVRIRFAKVGKVRWTSHRDLARVWERTLRRAELPVSYTEGFSPRPKLSFGLALSTGHESLAEYLDVDLATDIDLDGLPARLSACLPVGVDVLVTAPAEPGAPSLQQDVTSCSWELAVAGIGVDAAREAVASSLAADRLVIERTRKGESSVDDVRGGIVDLRVVGERADDEGEVVVLTAELATMGRSLRPAELLLACLAGAEERRVLRTHQWIDRDGARREPLPLPIDAASLPHACAVCG